METDFGYEFDCQAARTALECMSGRATNPNNRGTAWCLVRKDRNLSRFQPALGPPYFSDAPDTVQREGAIERRFVIDIPMLMIRQNGTEGQRVERNAVPIGLRACARALAQVLVPVRAPRGLARLRGVAEPFKHYRFHGCSSHPQLLTIRIETSRLDGDFATDLSLAG